MGEGGKRPAEESAQAVESDAAVETATARPRKRRSGWDDVGDGTQVAAPMTVPMSVPPGAAVVEFKVDQGVVGFLIGKGGETLRSMEVSSTATIKIDQSPKEMGYSMVRITGSEQAVAVAKALLDGRVNEKRANANRRDFPGGSSGGGGGGGAPFGVSDSGAVGWETQIDQSNVGFFIGKQGEYIKRIQAQTGATVVIDQETKEYGYSMIRIMDGPGLREASELVKYRLDQVKEAAVQRAPAGEYEEIAIRQNQVGAIIGKGGGTLKQIKADSGAVVVLSQEMKGQGFSTLRFAGSPGEIEKAKELVNMHLEAQNVGNASGNQGNQYGTGSAYGYEGYGYGEWDGVVNQPPPAKGHGKNGKGLGDPWGGVGGGSCGSGYGGPGGACGQQNPPPPPPPTLSSGGPCGPCGPGAPIGGYESGGLQPMPPMQGMPPSQPMQPQMQPMQSQLQPQQAQFQPLQPLQPQFSQLQPMQPMQQPVSQQLQPQFQQPMAAMPATMPTTMQSFQPQSFQPLQPMTQLQPMQQPAMLPLQPLQPLQPLPPQPVGAYPQQIPQPYGC